VAAWKAGVACGESLGTLKYLEITGVLLETRSENRPGMTWIWAS